jgi:hypothetical protein
LLDVALFVSRGIYLTILRRPSQRGTTIGACALRKQWGIYVHHAFSGRSLQFMSLPMKWSAKYQGSYQPIDLE